MPFRLVRNVRTLQRLRTIAQVLTKHGFGHLVERVELVRFVPLWLRPHARKTTEAQEGTRLGERLAEVCNELGPSFIKLGQMLSTRPDLLPPDLIDDLKKLQDQVEPFASEDARNIILEDLGEPPSNAFASFESAPFASGSIAQVYNAITNDGQAVVVKVRRPSIDSVIRNDMHILTTLAEAAERYVPELASYHPMQIVDEFNRSITRELDFVNEASATARFRAKFEDDQNLCVPEVRWDLTGSQVLTLQKLEGVNVNQVLEDQAPEIDRRQLAENIAAVFLKQYFDIGMFHADPHPGNMLISPPAKLGLIDFGMIGQVSEEMMTQLMVALLGAVNRQIDWVVDVLAELGNIGPNADIQELKRDMQQLLDKYYGLPLKRLDLPTIAIEITDVVRRNDVTLPRDFVLLAKSLAMSAGTVLQLDPDLNLVELLQPRLKGLVLKRFSAQKLLKTAAISGWHILNILKNAPAQMRTAIRHLTRGEWQVNIQHQNLDRLARELDRASNRVAFAMIISSTIIGSSMMLASNAQEKIFGIDLQWFGIAGYVFAGLMGLWLIWAIFRSGRLY